VAFAARERTITGGVMSRYCRSHRLAFHAAGLIAATLVACTAVHAQEIPLVRAPATPLARSATHHLSAVDLSPDGRWVVYVMNESESTANLWVRPASNGEGVRLTSGNYRDEMPYFAPSGDRIFFRSNRPQRHGEASRFYMSIAFDARTGRASGPPRQVTLEGIATARTLIPRPVSPDGRWLLYYPCCSERSIRIVPAEGGEARVIARPPAQPGQIVWSSDGESVLYVYLDAATETRHRVRAFLDGRPEQTVLSTQEPPGIALPDGRHAIRVPLGSAMDPREGTLLDGYAQPLARFEVPEDFALRGISPDGRAILGRSSQAGGALTYVPLAGGPSLQITTGERYDWPQGWSARGEIVHATRVADSLAITSGTVRRVLSPPPGQRVAVGAVAGDWVAYSVGDRVTNRSLRVLNMVDGREITLSDMNYQVPGNATVRGAGGWYGLSGEDFIFYERDGSRVRLVAARPNGATRLLRELPVDVAARGPVSVAGSRIAWTGSGDRAGDLLIAAGSTDQPRRVYAAPAQITEITFSHDGARVALGLADGSFQVLRLGADLSVIGEPQVVPVPFEYWYETQWLPDASGFTTLAQIRGEPEPDIVLIRLNDPQRPVNLTRDDPNPVWGYALAPDGSRVAYPSEINRGSTVWRIDLGPVLGAVRR
jgi:dipeptidyl aminopeptidase/acylaminoacyl peptidase